jgi:hypothetical protein
MDPDGHDRAIIELRAAAQPAEEDPHPLNPISRALGRHEVIQSQDAKQPSIEQLFKDVDMIKSQIRTFERPMLTTNWKDKMPSLFTLGVFLKLEEEIMKLAGVKHIRFGDDHLHIAVDSECPDKDGLQSQITRLVHQYAPHLSFIQISEVSVQGR